MMISTMLLHVLIIGASSVCFCVDGISIFQKYDDDELFNQRMVLLARDVATDYMAGPPSCVAVISEHGLLADFNGYNRTTILRMNFNGTESSCDPNLHHLIHQAFIENCRANLTISEKHTPKVLFLPMKPYAVFYGEDVLSVNETNISQDILIAEISEENASGVPEWPVTLFTNNFWQHVGEPERTGMVYIDEWSWVLGFKRKVNLYPDKVTNLQGKVLRVATFEYLPYGMLEPILDGSEVRLILHFCEIYNCSLGATYDGALWGKVFPENGTGIGLAGLVYSENADFGMAANYLWVEFWQYIEYSNCYLYGALTVLTPKPELLGGLLTPFLPFPASLWLVVFLTVVVSSVGLHVFTRATFRLIPYMRDDIHDNPKFISYTDSILRSVGMLVLQQPNVLVTGSPTRHIFTAFEVLYLVVTSAYAAELYDYLTIPRSTKPIDTIEDLAESNLIWMADHEVWIFGISHSTDPFSKKVVANFRIFSVAELIEQAENGRFGLGIERMAGGHFTEVPQVTEKVIQKSRVMKSNYYLSPLVTFLQKGSPYAKRLNQFIGRVLNGGLFYYWEADSVRKYLNYKNQMDLLQSSKPVQYPPKVLSLNDLIGAFLLYFLGMVISTVFFVVELTFRATAKTNHSLLDPIPKWYFDYMSHEPQRSDQENIVTEKSNT